MDKTIKYFWVEILRDKDFGDEPLYIPDTDNGGALILFDSHDEAYRSAQFQLEKRKIKEFVVTPICIKEGK